MSKVKTRTNQPVYHAPSGGTKLYKHVIALNDSQFKLTPLTFITNFSQPLTNIEEFTGTNKGLILYKSITYNTDNQDIFRLGINSDSKFEILINDSTYFNENANVTSSSDAYQITFTDTVTEL